MYFEKIIGMTHIFLKKEPKLSSKFQSFPYQGEAVQAIRDLEYAAIFHEQGLGKTKIAIDVLLYWLDRKEVDTVLIVAKKSLLANWQKEFRTHTFIKPRMISGNHRANHYVFNSPARVMLTHYEAIKGEKDRFELFLKTRDVAIILDESTKIKNPDSSIASVLFRLAPLFKRRVIMTGTPVANRPFDIWSQIWFLDQGKSLGNDYARFRGTTDLSKDLFQDKTAQAEYEKILDQIFEKIASFSVRQTKADGVMALPEKIIRTVLTSWETRQHELYKQIRDETRAIVIRDGVPSEDNADEVLKRLLRLVQISSNPQLIDESYRGDPGKVDALTGLVDNILSRDEKCIVWTSFTENVDWLAERLKVHGVAKVHGKLPMALRNAMIERFLGEVECRILIATPGAAKEGLTLTVANHVVFFDRSFSLDDYLQAQDRIHRISQKKTCYVYNLVMQDSVDEWVSVLLRAKQLAAQLAQGDITLEHYRSQMTYDFGEWLKRTLGIDE